MEPSFKLTAAVLDSADANALAAFYHQLLGPAWVLRSDEPGWATLRQAGGAGWRSVRAGVSDAADASTPRCPIARVKSSPVSEDDVLSYPATSSAARQLDKTRRPPAASDAYNGLAVANT